MRDFRHAGTKALALALPAGMAISPRAAVVFLALWLLPEWVERWLDVVKQALDVRDRRRR